MANMEVGVNPYQIKILSKSNDHYNIINWCKNEFGSYATTYDNLGIDGKWIAVITIGANIYINL
jgi:hypothetical protein